MIRSWEVMTGWYERALNPQKGSSWHRVRARGWTVIWDEEPERFEQEMYGAVERAHPEGAPCTCGFEKPYKSGNHWRVTPLGHKLFAYALEHGEIDELTIAVARACE